MQKVTAFLEQHIQWIAIGLGALFCLYMTYSYVITPPAEVTIDNVSYGPSEIDPYTAENVVRKLQTAMQTNKKVELKVPQYVQTFESKMKWEGAKPIALAMIDRSYAADVPLPPAPRDPNAPPPPPNGDPNQVPPGAVATKIKQLPVPPKPKQTDPTTFVKYGRSVIVPPTAPGQPAPVPQPGVVPPNAVDKDWVTQMWTVSMADVDAAFRKAGMDKLPQGLNKTMFLQVEMVRQEMIGDKWGNEVVVAQNGPTRNNQPMLPYPGDGPNPSLRQAQFQYAAWASTSTPDIIQPLFHVTVPNKGDQWTKPGPQIGPGVVFNPATHVGGKGNLTEEQWQAVLQYRREQQKLLMEQKKNAAPRGPRPPPGGRGGPPMGPGMEGDSMNYAPRRDAPAPAPAGSASKLPNFAVPPPPGGPRAPFYPPQRGVPYGLEGDLMEGDMGGYGGGAQAPGLPQPGTDYPNGEFDPCEATVPPPAWKLKEVEIWAHDDNVVAGKTYRYRMRYRLKNPIFGTNNTAEPPELANQLGLPSEFSEWTSSITVPSLVNFFVAGGVVRGRSTVDFEIFRWDNGQQKSERFSIGPGDAVGGERNGVDYSTDWTVVDFREDPRAGGEYQILLVNDKDGSVKARSYAGDRTDKLYEALKAQVKAANAAAAAANGVVTPTNGTAAAR